MPINNMIRMRQRAKNELNKQKEDLKAKLEAKMAEKVKNIKLKIEEKKAAQIKEPPFLDTLMNFMGSFKVHIKRIHFRYEDDYFQHHKPFSFGLMIDSITIDNSDFDWTFESPLSINISKQQTP